MRYILFFLLLLPLSLLAGGWPQPQGAGFFKLDHTAIITRQYFGTQGELVPIRTLGNYTTSFYGEYGLTNRLTAQAYIPFFVRNTLNRTVGNQTGNEIEAGAANNQIGDIDLGFKYGLFTQGKVVASASLWLGLPTGDSQDQLALFTGDGEFNQLLKLEFGASGGKWYAGWAAGFNNRTGGFSDEFRYDAEFGVKFLRDKMWAILKVNGIESLYNGKPTGANVGLFSNNVEYLAVSPEVVYQLPSGWGVTARIGGALRGINVLAAPSWSLGVFYRLL